MGSVLFNWLHAGIKHGFQPVPRAGSRHGAIKYNGTHISVIVDSSANTWYGLESIPNSGVEPVKHDGTHTVVNVYSSTNKWYKLESTLCSGVDNLYSRIYISFIFVGPRIKSFIC